jgi:phosphoribosyl-AMP cyclohydrolase
MQVMKAPGRTMDAEAVEWLDAVNWQADGLVPAIAQDAVTGRVLTLAWMNREALLQTERTKEVHYWSRSRRAHVAQGRAIGTCPARARNSPDCDNDAILVVVEQEGGIACHTGRETCFFQRLTEGRWISVEPVREDPGTIYGTR